MSVKKSCWSALPTLDSCLEGLDVVTSCLLLLKRAAWTKPKAVCLFVFIISIFKISSIPAASLYWSKQKSLTCSNVTFPTESHTTLLVLFQRTVITGTNHLAPSCALSFSLGVFFSWILLFQICEFCAASFTVAPLREKGWRIWCSTPSGFSQLGSWLLRSCAYSSSKSFVQPWQ